MKLTQEYLISILDYDLETGSFKWKFRPSERIQWNAQNAGKEAGCISVQDDISYKRIGINGKLYSAHRLAWLYTYGELPSEIDHRDGNGLNNKIANLRKSSRSQNQCNRGMMKNNKSGYKGVFYHSKRDKWIASISVNKKRVHIGQYDSARIAHEAYCSAAKWHHGEFARVS